MKKVVILGAGTWGTALANLLASKNVDITLYTRFEEECQIYSSTRKHPHLPGATINEKIYITWDIEEALKDKDVVLIATPSLYVRETMERIKHLVNKNQIFITVSKGIEKDTLMTMSEIIEDVLGEDAKTVALSGPTHAEEVSIGLPTAIVSASKDTDTASIIQELFATPYMRVYHNTDIKGVELCGALKNIVALASGISSGLGYGDNAIAAIVTRGLAEITRLGLKMGCQPETFYGLTGIGDIVVTATSRHSRNNKAGYLLGKGYSLEDTLNEVGMVVEGINALDAAKELEDKYNVEMPIVNAVYSVVRENKKPQDAVNELFARKQISELTGC